MTISAYTGLPGHGKSYGVVENVIIPALKSKKPVFTNIPMNTEECLNRFKIAPTFFDINDIIKNENWWFEVFESGSIIIIDEVWRLWPSGLNASKARYSDKSFLAEHRHMVGKNGQSTEIILVTQDLGQLANFVRSLVENTFRVTKQTKLGLNSAYRVDVYFGSVTGNNPPTSKRHREIHGKFKKNVFTLYKSHTKSETGQAGDETRIDDRFNVLKGASWKVGIAVIIVLGLFVSYGLDRVSEGYGMQDQPEQAQQQQPQPQPQTQQVPVQTVQQSLAIEFLSLADEIHVVSHINKIVGSTSQTIITFKVVINDSETHLTNTDLLSLDYQITSVNRCLVRINGSDFNQFVLCPTDEKDTFFDEMIPVQQTPS
jgi:zona occludens toxin